MKKKSFIKFLSVAASTVLVLAACGQGEEAEQTDSNQNATGSENVVQQETDVTIVAGAPMQDGTYSLLEKELDQNGWKASFELIVEDGKITGSNYNYENEEGRLKTENEGYQEAMKDKTGVGPQEFIPQLNDALIAQQDAQKVDVVTGATHSSESFINYAQQLIQAAQKGDTTPIEIDAQAPLQDGEYSLEEKNIGSTGWKTYINIIVEAGKIVEVDYNYLNAEGQLKTEDDAYQDKMTEIAGTGPQDFVPALSESLIETQNAADVDVVTGATHSAHTFKLYAAQLINSAQKGDTTPIIIDNYVYEEQ